MGLYMYCTARLCTFYGERMRGGQEGPFQGNPAPPQQRIVRINSASAAWKKEWESEPKPDEQIMG